MIIEPRTEKENEMNTVRNIRVYLARLAAAASCLLVVSASAGSANVACNVQGGVATLRLYVGQAPGVWTKTNVFTVPQSISGQTVTNLLTNLVAGVNYIAGQVVGVNNVVSDMSTNLQVTVPAAPDSIITVPLSLVVPLGVPVQISRDGETWIERLKITADAKPGFVSVTYRMIPDQPALFFRQQPAAAALPIP
jgi:hypothetical protein